MWMSPESLAKNKGELPARSGGHAGLTLADYRRIPEIIDSGEVYRQSDERLIFQWRTGCCTGRR
ncbi:MAG: hypothetical protein HY885_11175 [Deltaproteobacteria bacterium]|nr:hypothetical protein [Deltaproteobacteria bacterium]